MSPPTLSVCIPVFNPGTYLAEAITSILSQDYSNYELLVVDDASDQDLSETLLPFIDSRLRVVRNRENLGLVGNWNRCLTLAQGQYVAILHQDDLMLQGNLTAKVGVLESSSLIGLVYSNAQTIGAAGERLGDYPIRQPDRDVVFPGCHLFELTAQLGNPAPCSSVIVRSDLYRRIGGFDPRLSYAADMHMWLRLAAACHVGYLAEPLISVRVHPAQVTRTYLGTGRDYEDVLRAFDLVFSSRDLPTDCAAYASRSYLTLARHALSIARWKLRPLHPLECLRHLSVALRGAFRASRAHASDDAGVV